MVNLDRIKRTISSLRDFHQLQANHEWLFKEMSFKKTKKKFTVQGVHEQKNVGSVSIKCQHFFSQTNTQHFFFFVGF